VGATAHCGYRGMELLSVVSVSVSVPLLLILAGCDLAIPDRDR
jgi:hypothetical protein